MIPSIIKEETQSPAERQMFQRFREQLDGSWTVLHSLGLGNHPRKAWAEIDFVAIGPSGVFSFEVKGGRVERKEGTWVFTDRNGHETKKKEGPFDQVGSASAALRSSLAGRFAFVREALVGYAVMTPDIRFAIKGVDVIPEVVYDRDDTARALESFVTRIESYWQDRLGARRRLTKAECNAIVEFLRGDFDIHPTLGTLVAAVEEELVVLTEEQYRVMDALEENDRVIIRGGAGTGKTLLAAAEAARWSAHGARVLMTCFNRNLAGFLRQSLDQRAPTVEVMGLHKLMYQLISDAGMLDRLPRDLEGDQLFRIFYPEVASKALTVQNEKYDVIVLDEGQDLLLDGYTQVLSALVKGGLEGGIWRLFLDTRQDLYDATSRRALSAYMAAAPAQVTLTLNCRNTTPIALETALLSRSPLAQVLRAEGPEVETRWFTDDADQSQFVASKVRSLLAGGLAAHKIALLSPFTRERSRGVANLSSLDAPVADISREGWSRDHVLFSTIAGFKGLEADAVILMDGYDISDTQTATYYVGTSRARVLLAVLLHEGMREEYALSANVFGESEAERARSEASRFLGEG